MAPAASNTSSLRWAILGTGAIARQFAQALERSSRGRLICVASRSAAFTAAPEFGGAEIVAGYETALARTDVEAVYIATPHPNHAEWAIKAARAGKHVLCEKPIGMNAAEATAIFDAGEQNGVLIVEAFMYRTHPQTSRLHEILASGRIGRVRLMSASYGYNKAYDPEARHFSNALGGGAILDVGCYCVSMSRLVAGAASGKSFADPVSVQGQASRVETGADENATAILTFADGMVSRIACSLTTVQDNTVRIFGEKGWIEVPSPWFCSGRQGGSSVIRIHQDGDVEDIVIDCSDWLYSLEADAFAASVAAGRAQGLAPSPADTLGNMRALDAWRRAGGVTYVSEAPGRSPRTYAGIELARPGQSAMGHVSPLPIGKSLSRLAIGCMGFETYPDAQALYDAFFEAGGNVFDTAHIYKKGLSDTLLGHWVKSRDVREDAVIIGKGAHSPNCYPETIGRELAESLERLQTDYIDIYFMHRDNLDIPVGEFVDVLDDFARKGTIRAFGGSNWTLERLGEANAYAQRAGRQGFSAVSNQFSLAEMLEPVWPDCISSSDADSIAWLRGRNMPLFAWSSQARGFFTDAMNPDDPATIRSWLSERNLGRRERARILADRYGTTMPTIALAYLLHLDFPVFPIIGPLTIAELRMSLAALEVSLAPEDVQWLADGDRP
ncbi:aldo/keto reductase [Pelagibacterium montanilacus]|uniref:aldo/keto reductase n=1 Tax=Pelagibacterium montanilacus TaxID=2185280 RepID=UPI000F8F2C02|nr:aldo/keto reductase [Pelagibacterium montanilacus]